MAKLKNYTLSCDGEPDVRFRGELIAEADSYLPTNSGGRWTELRLFRTEGGKLVAEEVGRTQWQGERDRHTVTVCDDEAAVIEALGHGRLAKELYAEAGIDDVVTVD